MQNNPIIRCIIRLSGSGLGGSGLSGSGLGGSGLSGNGNPD
jgi:hypothetical protein